MCKVCAEAIHCLALCQAVHFVALWTRVTSRLRTCEVCTEAVHSTVNTSYITGFAVCSYLTHLWCSYLSPKTGISVFLFDAFVVFLFEPGPLSLGIQLPEVLVLFFVPSYDFVEGTTHHPGASWPKLPFSIKHTHTHLNTEELDLQLSDIRIFRVGRPCF